MSTTPSIEDRVRKAISDLMQISLADVKPESDITALGGDSLTRVEVCMVIEDEFGIDVPDADAEPITTVQGWINYVSAQPTVKA